ncbi:MAG: hypothetical protein GY810_04140 [Aureispira sp.]|nr:hypothetical protein [Aureispira sp.]
MNAAKSIWLFGYYVIAMGLILLFIPHIILDFAGLTPVNPEHRFIYHIVGLIASVVGLYYVHCGKTNQREFFKISVVGRMVFFVGAIVVVLLTSSNPKLAIIGITDLLGAAWTYWALKKDEKNNFLK